jgi:hypothetical protein
MHDENAKANQSPALVFLAHAHGQMNMLPWRPPWLAKRMLFLRLGIALLLVLVLLMLSSFYALHWQRQHYVDLLAKRLLEQVQISQGQFQPLRNQQALWLYKQAAIVENAKLRQQSQMPMQQLLTVQTMLQNIDAQVKSLQIKGQKIEVSLVSSIPWEQLQSEWWLPVSGRIGHVKQHQQEAGNSQWQLRVELGD